jgi:hypothetical protein
LFKFINQQIEQWYSEPISIKSEHQDTIQLVYTNSGNDFDAYFGPNQYNIGQTSFTLRVEGGFRSDGFQPSSIDNAFYDQTHNATMLSSVPFNVKKITFGTNLGIPNYIVDKINRALSCDTVYVDNQLHQKVDGAKLEKTFLHNYPKGIWTIDLVEGVNNYSDYADVIKKTPAGIGSMVINEYQPISAVQSTFQTAYVINKPR